MTFSDSDEAVEAAAKVLFEDGFDGPPFWETHTGQDEFRASARRILAAAAPHLMAQAWDEGEAAGYRNNGCEQWGYEQIANPYRAAGAVEVSPSGVAFIRTTAKKYIPEAPSAGDGE